MRRIWRAATAARVAGLLMAAAGLLMAALVAAWGLSTVGTPSAMAAVASPAGTVASVTPAMAGPGADVTFTVSCASASAASATLSGQALGLQAQVPMDAVAASGHFSIEVTLPGTIRPGTYHAQLSCSDGTSARATVRVTELAAAAGTAADARGSSGGAGTALTVGGLVLIGVGVVAGGMAIRRLSGRSSTRS